MNSLHRCVVALVLTGAALVAIAAEPAVRPVPVLPQSLTWFSPPDNPALQGSWVLGAEKQPGPYLLRVKLGAGGKIAPHRHPDERVSTVLAGTIYVGFGSVFDASKVVAIPTGGVYVAPANLPHYVWAKDGEAQYQEAGFGPTGNLPPR
ncbi:MAG: cupin domain-containing protein [Pseudomonadota bacterium]